MIKMETGIYLFFLIFCATFFQVILNFSEEHIDKSWDLHIRKKRIIDKTPHGNKPVKIEHVPYIVGIYLNGWIRPNCGGSILTSTVVITAAHCVVKEGVYTVLSGSALVKKGIEHNVISKIKHHLYNENTQQYDVALLHIYPGIDLKHSPNRRIDLYQGDVTHHYGTISGWGCIDKSEEDERVYSLKLRSIVVPIVKHEACNFIYGGTDNDISDKNICTFYKNKDKCCCNGDSGGPLVVDGKLVGVLSWTGGKIDSGKPDVFTMVSHPLIRSWIVTHVRIIEVL